MKATQKNFGGTIDRAVRAARVFYLCGPDDAGASDAAGRIMAMLGTAERVDLTGADLKRDPARLADEARSASLFGDARVIRITMAGDEAHDAVAGLIADTVPGWPVVIHATGATDKSRLAKLLEPRADALVAIFHPPDLSHIADAIRSEAEGLGLMLTTGLAQTIARGAALDSRIARSELEKLALYLDASPQSPRSATPADLAAIGTETADDGTAMLVNAALGGQTARLAEELPRLTAGDVNPVGLLLAFERRAAQLAQLAARLGSGGNVSAFIEAETQARRIFFRDKADLLLQLHKWRGARLERLIDRLAALHRAMLEDSGGAPLRLSQAIAEITRAAAGNRVR